MNINDIANNLQYVRIQPKTFPKKRRNNAKHTKQLIEQSFGSLQNVKQVEKIYQNKYPVLYECKLVDPKNISKTLKVDMLIRYSFSDNHLSSVCAIIKIVHDIREKFYANDPPNIDNENEFVKTHRKQQDVIPIEYIVVKNGPKLIKLSPYSCFIFIALRKLSKKHEQIMGLKNMITLHQNVHNYNKQLNVNDPIDDVLKIIESNS